MQQLDQLLGPIALYPDPLIAQILPASTLPTQIVLADRYVSGGGDPNQIDQQPWDPSVQALARYPSVLKWMDDNLNWTTELGQAFLNQQPDVMDSIQRLRQSAYNLGNLQSTPQQQVINDGGDIEIVPADPQVIYVPVYQPDQVYYQSAMARLSSPSASALRLAPGWIAILTGDTTISLSGVAIIRVRPIGGMSLRASGTRVTRRSGIRTIIRAQSRQIMATGAMGFPITSPWLPRSGRSMWDSAAPRRTPAPATRPEAPATRTSTPVARPAPAPVATFSTRQPAGIERRIHRHPEFARHQNLQQSRSAKHANDNPFGAGSTAGTGAVLRRRWRRGRS